MRTRCVGKVGVRSLAAVAAVGFLTTAAAQAETEEGFALKERVPEIQNRIAGDYSRLESLYKHFHQHPELSLQEVQTSARLTKELREIGFEVTPNVGGHGIVGVLKNGDGPTVLVRTDMDALPVVEQTGLPYASKQHARDKNGNEV